MEHEPFYSFRVSYVLFPSHIEHKPGLHLSYVTINMDFSHLKRSLKMQRLTASPGIFKKLFQNSPPELGP